MVKALRVVFMGTPQFAVPTLEALVASRHTVAGVITQPDRARGRGQQLSFGPVKTLALARHLPVFQPERLRDPTVEETLRGWTPDLGVVAAYGKIIPEPLLQVPPLGMINVHASLLPALRGAAPVHRSVIDGCAETGVTIMRVVKALDAGATFATATRVIGPDDTSVDVERDLAILGAELLVEVVNQIADGSATEVPQDESRVTYAARLTKEEGLIDWSSPARTIHNRVRGLYPWPHAYTYLDGRRLIVLRTKVLDQPSGAAPGTVVGIDADGMQVATGDGCLLIEQIQPEGRRAMAVRDFIAGHRVTAGQRFTSIPPSPIGTSGKP
jgi:methionyl-tRNA formyltransferase